MINNTGNVRIRQHCDTVL